LSQDTTLPTDARLSRAFRMAIVAAFLIMLAIGILLPVYGDEIGWRFQERAWIDIVDRAYSDLCGANTFAAPPWFMLPVRWFSAMANQAFADPLFVRLEGVICACAWAGLLWTLIARLEPDRERRVRVQTLVFALLGMGMLPLLLVMSRPEQPLLLMLTLMMLVALARGGTAAAAWPKCAAIVLLTVIAASYHLKSVAFSPIALACLIVCARGRGSIAPRLLGTAAMTAIMAAAAAYWVGRFRCLGDPVLAHKLGAENIASSLSTGASLQDLMLRVVENANPLHYVGQAVPDNEPMSAWVPYALFPAPLPDVFAVVMYLVWTAALLTALICLLRFALREGLHVLAEPRAVLALATFACVAVWGASQVNRNVYEAAMILPLLAVFIVLCVTLPGTAGSPTPGPVAPIPAALVWTTGAAAILSQAVLLIFVMGVLMKAAGDPGHLADQPYSVSITRYGAVKADIATAMRRAGMDPRTRYRGLMVDEVTYLALQRHLLPIHRLGVLQLWNGNIARPAEYLLSRHSDGVIVVCSNLPPDLAAVAARSGEICAISQAGLKRSVGATLPRGG
jgi:hypothetical protein